MIILGHTEASWDHADPSSILNATLCWTIPNTALVSFFFLGGYLLFAGRDTYSAREYMLVLRSRTVSLLIPYIIWIAVGCACAVAAGHPDTIGYPYDFVEIFWSKGAGTPEHSLLGYDFHKLAFPGGHGVLWYVRDLMIMTLLSPVVWFFTKILRRSIFPILMAAILLNAGVPGIDARATCYFTLGAAFAIHGIDPVNLSRRMAVIIIPVWILLCLVVSTAVWNFDINHILHGPRTLMLRYMMEFSGVFALFAIASLSLRPRGSAEDRVSTPFNRLMLMLAPAGFFIYVVHTLAIVEAFSRITDPLVPEKWQTFTAFIYFTVARLSLIPLLYFALARVAPRTLAVITGGRTPRRPAPIPTPPQVARFKIEVQKLRSE